MKLQLALMFIAITSSGFAQSTPPPSEMLDAKFLHATSNELLNQAKTAKDGIAWKVLLTRPDGNEQEAVREERAG